MALIAHFVAADSNGVGLTLFDRSSLANDATVVPDPGGQAGPWLNLDSGCACVFIEGAGSVTGCLAPDNAAYTVTDYVEIVCGSSFGGPSEFYGLAQQNPGAGVARKRVFGFGVPGSAHEKRTCIHLSDGSSFETIDSDDWPVAEVVQFATVIPGGGDTMEGMYAVAVKRVGNDFTFFFKGAAFRTSTGACIDPMTGDPATVPAAVTNGTATSTIQPGNISADLNIAGSVEESFKCNNRVSWYVLYDAVGGLPTDEEILALLDAAYPVCGTSLETVEINADLVVNAESVFQPVIGSSAQLAICSTFVEHVCLILTADWEFGRQVVPIYRNDLIFVNGSQQVLAFVNGDGEEISFNATGLLLSKADVAGVYGHYLGWTARGSATPFRIETIEMEYQSTRAWDTSP